MDLAVFNAQGKKTADKVKLSDDIFGIEPNDHAIYLDVKRTQAAKRQGTSKAKERAEVKGSRRKIKKQKGTGTARAGDIKNPLFVGGGTVFGPRPRKYTVGLNKKVRKLARKSALSYKAKEEGIMVLDQLSMDTPKTKDFLALLNNLKVADKKTLIVLANANDGVRLSSRNLQGHKVVTAESLNTYDILNCNSLILVKDSVEVIEKQLNK